MFWNLVLVYPGLLIHTQQQQQATFSDFSDSKVLKRPNMCYIFEKHGIQGYKIWHSRVSWMSRKSWHVLPFNWLTGQQIQDNLLTKCLGFLWTPFFNFSYCVCLCKSGCLIICSGQQGHCWFIVVCYLLHPPDISWLSQTFLHKIQYSQVDTANLSIWCTFEIIIYCTGD